MVKYSGTTHICNNVTSYKRKTHRLFMLCYKGHCDCIFVELIPRHLHCMICSVFASTEPAQSEQPRVLRWESEPFQHAWPHGLCASRATFRAASWSRTHKKSKKPWWGHEKCVILYFTHVIIKKPSDMHDIYSENDKELEKERLTNYSYSLWK